jgi:hypothetical protein
MKSMSGLGIMAHFPRFATVVFAGALVFGSPALAEESGPFSAMAGNWVGAGNIVIGSSPGERIRCRADYKIGNAGTTVALGLRCASDSYKFELQGNVRYQNGEVRGDWSERTRGAAGQVAGSISGNQVNVRVDGQTFSGLLSLTTRGNKQSISIKAPVGSQMSEANITLSRGG